MRTVVWGLYGAVLGTLLVGVVGVLSVQATGLRAGAVFGLDNILAGITSPRTPYLPMLGIAAVSSLVVWTLTVGPRRRPRLCRVGLVVGFSVSTVALITLSFVITPDVDARRELLLGVLPGWQGWIHKGGSESAVHLLLILAIGSLWLHPGRRPDRPAGAGGGDGTGGGGGGAAAGAEPVIDLGER